jgi:hypothetical protein
MKPNNLNVDNNMSDINKIEMKCKQIWSLPMQNKSQHMPIRWQNRTERDLIPRRTNAQNCIWIQDDTGRRLANSGARIRTSKSASTCICREQTPVREANTSSARQESDLSRNPKIHYLVHKRLLLEPVIKQVCPVHTLTRISLRSILISPPHICPGVQMVSFLYVFRLVFCVYLSSLRHPCVPVWTQFFGTTIHDATGRHGTRTRLCTGSLRKLKITLFCNAFRLPLELNEPYIQ